MTNQTALADDEISAVIGPLSTMPGALLPILHALQDRFGHVPETAVPLVAKALNLSRAEVHGTITFYHHFRQHPVGRHVVHVCRAEACQAVGADALVEHARQSLGCDFHGTTKDNAITLEPAYCLGQCATGPALLIDDEIHAKVTPARFDSLVKGLRGGAK
ncbi:MAG TPA: formate dehydrogenase subunit gamma [Magnetospirillaceae bacterium]|nr:formate dehydrogenase subunit gamma [Magnetospirillaceae bacterium]